MNNRWIVKHDGEIVYQPQTIDAKILDISDEALEKIAKKTYGWDYFYNQFKDCVEENVRWEQMYNEKEQEIQKLKAQLKEAEKLLTFVIDGESIKDHFESYGYECASDYLEEYQIRTREYFKNKEGEK